MLGQFLLVAHDKGHRVPLVGLPGQACRVANELILSVCSCRCGTVLLLASSAVQVDVELDYVLDGVLLRRRSMMEWWAVRATQLLLVVVK